MTQPGTFENGLFITIDVFFFAILIEASGNITIDFAIFISTFLLALEYFWRCHALSFLRRWARTGGAVEATSPVWGVSIVCWHAWTWSEVEHVCTTPQQRHHERHHPGNQPSTPHEPWPSILDLDYQQQRINVCFCHFNVSFLCSSLVLPAGLLVPDLFLRELSLFIFLEPWSCGVAFFFCCQFNTFFFFWSMCTSHYSDYRVVNVFIWRRIWQSCNEVMRVHASAVMVPVVVDRRGHDHELSSLLLNRWLSVNHKPELDGCIFVRNLCTFIEWNPNSNRFIRW